jgi:hypothetical protein
MHLSLCLSNAESPQLNKLYDVDVGTRLASGSKTSSGCVLTREAERQSGLADKERGQRARHGASGPETLNTQFSWAGARQSM